MRVQALPARRRLPVAIIIVHVSVLPMAEKQRKSHVAAILCISLSHETSHENQGEEFHMALYSRAITRISRARIYHRRQFFQLGRSQSHATRARIIARAGLVAQRLDRRRRQN